MVRIGMKMKDDWTPDKWNFLDSNGISVSNELIFLTIQEILSHRYEGIRGFYVDFDDEK